jgi:4-amino-4-deoxy-L-arabinose transferase-like glycosyltransferase
MSAAATSTAVRARRVVAAPAVAIALVAAAAGIVIRTALYGSVLGGTNSDEAVLGLMARHALHGEFTTFLWGTPYGGPQEALLAAPLFALFGSSLLALRAVSMTLNAAAAVLLWRVGRRTIGERRAVVAAGLFWVWPPDFLFLQLHEIGFYASNGFYCALILLLVLRARERPSALRVGLVGLVCGLAVWETTQIVPVAVPAVVWLAWRQPRALRRAWAAVPLAILGALPFIVWTFTHHFASLHLSGGAPSTYWWRLRVFFSPLLPMALGLRMPGTMEWLLPYGLAALAFCVLLALLAYGAYRSRRSDTLLFYVVAIVCPFLLMISPRTFYTGNPQYLSVLMPVAALLVAQLAHTYARAGVLLLLALAVTAVSLHKLDDDARANRSDPSRTPRDIAPLIATLDRLHVRDAFADYWIAYRIDFDSRERIVAVENKFYALRSHNGALVPTPDPFVRSRDYDEAVRRSAEPGFVFLRQHLPRRRILATLTAHGYRRHEVQNFAVYARPD